MFRSRLFFLVVSFWMDVCRKLALVLLPVSKHYALFGSGFSLNPRVINVLKERQCPSEKIFAMLYPKLPRGGDRTSIIGTDKKKSLWYFFLSVHLFHGSRIKNLPGTTVILFIVINELKVLISSVKMNKRCLI